MHDQLHFCLSRKQSIYKYAELDTQLFSAAATFVAAPRRGGKPYVLLALRIEWDWGEINCGSLEVALLAALAPPPPTHAKTHWGIIAPPHKRGDVIIRGNCTAAEQ